MLAGSTALIAQYGRGRITDPGQFCTNLPDITDKQKTELAALSEKHRAAMDALRSELWSSTDRTGMSEVATKMQNLRNSHLNDIRLLLTDKQKEIFNSCCPAFRGRGVKGQAMGNWYGRGAGMSNWRGTGPGIGYGRGMGRGRY